MCPPNDLSTRDQKAFDFCLEAAKQMITLATGLIALGIAFMKDFAPTASGASRSVALWSWGLLVLSIVSGVTCILFMTGVLSGEYEREGFRCSVWEPPIRWLALAQMVLFVFGLAVTVWAASLSFSPSTGGGKAGSTGGVAPPANSFPAQPASGVIPTSGPTATTPKGGLQPTTGTP